jgi:hypothetical protein
MNPDTFDFNIKNYSIDDLENFLGLDDEYTEEEIHKKSMEFSNKINKINDLNFKKKLNEFVIQVRNILTQNDDKNSITAAGSTFVIN